MKLKQFIWFFLAILWLMVSVGFYYWGHKPIDPIAASDLLRLLLDLVINFLVVILAGGLGRRLFPASKANDGERLVVQAAVGYGLLAIFWLVLGAFPLYRPVVAWGVLVLGLFFLRSTCFEWLKSWGYVKEIWQTGGKLEHFLILFALLLIFSQLFFALAPPIKYDALSYHLQLPRQYIQAKQLIFIRENPYWGHPQLAEMIFTWMTLLHRAQTASLAGWIWGFLVTLGVFSSVCGSARENPYVEGEHRNNLGAVRAGLVSVIVLVSGFTFRSMLGWAYVDLLTALLGWGVMVCLFSALRSGDQKAVIWAGLLSGLAVGTKWTAAIIIPGFFLPLLLSRKKIDLSWRTLLLSGLLAMLAILPWLAKNTMATGNPFYPYLLPTQTIPAQRLSSASAAFGGMPAWQSILFPLTSTWLSWEGTPGFGADLGPMLILFLLPGLWTRRRDPAGVMVLIGLLFCWIAVAIGSQFINHMQQTRLYFVLLPAACVAASWGWEALAGIKFAAIRFERILIAFLLLVLVFSSIQEFFNQLQMRPAAVVYGAEGEDTYLERALGWYSPAVRALYDLSPGSKVLLLWEARGYYAPTFATADPWIDNWRVDYWKYRTTDKIRQAWLGQGYTHVLIYQAGAEIVRSEPGVLEPEGWKELDALLLTLPRPVSFGGVYLLYTLAE